MNEGEKKTTSVEAKRTIGELARQHGISVRTVRLYKQRGLLGCQTVRCYDDTDDARLAAVLRAKRLGLSLADIGRFVGLFEAAPRAMDGVERLRMRQLLDRQMALLVERRRGIQCAIDELAAALVVRVDRDDF